ncbi:MAG: D-tyrosyl-tRNA(Tyr) deacylase [Elusimicrobia bacterium]|nr:D-tyrosyl-tRNA(Tyr) deacylase [Elusimicrobiota bacterium]
MKIVLQRVTAAKVKNSATGESRKIGKGVTLLIGFHKGDTEDKIDYVVKKIANLRVFADDEGKSDFSVSLLEKNLEILAVPQFTLCGDVSRGRRPDFAAAAASSDAKVLFEKFFAKISAVLKAKEGWFGEYQEVEILNDGPVTIIIEK